MNRAPRTATVAAALLLALAAACGGDRATTTGAAGDREIAGRIRQALASDPALSTEAKNVAIATSQESVLLKGSVASESERAAVMAKARQVAGNRRVDDQLQVASR